MLFRSREIKESEDSEKNLLLENELRLIINEARKTAVKNMWLVCLSLMFGIAQDTIYSLCVLIFAKDCSPRHASE